MNFSNLAKTPLDAPLYEFLEMFVAATNQILNIFWRPARGIHTEMNAHLSQNFFDFIQRLAAKVRRTQHFRFGFLNQIADINDIVVLQAVGRTNRQFNKYFIR